MSTSKRSEVVYISGPYSNGGGTIEENITRARKVAIRYWEMGYTVICPHLNTINFENDCKLDWEDYVEGDLELIRRSDIIIMLAGWGNSAGATTEHAEARRLNKIVVYD